MTEWIYDPRAGRCRKTDGGQAVSDKIAEIRARHSLDDRWCNTLPQRHEDRATLLAEVDRLRAENERLCNEDTKTRHALGGWVWVCPDGGDEPTHERVAAVVAEVERQRAEIERLRDALTDMLAGWRYIRDTYGDLAGVGWDRVEQKAREALKGKP